MTRDGFILVSTIIACLALMAPGLVMATSGGDSPVPDIGPGALGRDSEQQAAKSALRVGDVLFAFMPGEIMLKLGEELRDHFGRPRLAPAAYVELREKMISLLTSVGLAPRKPGA